MKKIVLGAVCAATVVLCTGCAQIPDMTTAQNNAVAEYAANLLVSRSYSYRARYVDDLEPLTEPETEGSDDAETESPAIEPVTENETDVPDDFDISGDLGLGDVDVSYEFYKVVDEYPDDPEALFSFEPQDGCRFLVVGLKIHNPGTETVNIDNTDTTNIVKLRIGNRSCNNYANLLPNDITRLDNVTIEAGGDYESVVVFMVEDSIIDGMEEFELSTDGGESITIKK